MDRELSEIVLVIDRSGSMALIQSDAEGGVNEFVKMQKKQSGKANLTLVQFDTEYEVVYDGINIQDVPKYELIPRGCTALLDAVGKAIYVIGKRLSDVNESARPGSVIFVIVTDGHENSSVEFTKAQIRDMIQEQKTKYSWQFIYLGADDQAFDEAESIGIAGTHTMKYNKNKSGQAYGAAALHTSKIRCAASSSDDVNIDFSDDLRDMTK